MDCENLYEMFALFNSTGFTFTLEELSILQNSLFVLQNENNFQKVYFWGKIFTSVGAYYIAYGFTEDCIKDKKYFYSMNLTQWIVLHRPKPELEGIEQMTHIFKSTPASQMPVPGWFTEENKEKLKGLIEEKWLAYVVKMIRNEVEVVPRGFLLKNHNSVIVQNKYYQGLNFYDAQNIASYMHYRKPKQKWNTNLLTRNDFDFAVDFLDTIDRDVPYGSWVVNLDHDKKVVSLRSLLWPGMAFYLKLNSNVFCFLYIGNGVRNIDIPFMLQ